MVSFRFRYNNNNKVICLYKYIIFVTQQLNCRQNINKRMVNDNGAKVQVQVQTENIC